MRRIFIVSILFILRVTQYFRVSILLKVSNTQYFPGLDTAFTQHYEEISGDRYCLYFAIRKFLRGLDTAYTHHYPVFSGGRYCLFYAIRINFVESKLLILRNVQYFPMVDTVYTKRYA